MGAGAEASADCIELAEALGAASRGARRVDGHLVVGVLPGVGDESDRHDTADLDLALFTGIGQARNVVNVLSADVVVVCGAGGAGTASEAAHAIKAHRPLILLAVGPLWQQFFGSLSSDVACVDSIAECCDRIAVHLASATAHLQDVPATLPAAEGIQAAELHQTVSRLSSARSLASAVIRGVPS